MKKQTTVISVFVKMSFILLLIIGLFSITGYSKSNKKVVNKGDTVKVDYKGSLKDGTVFDQSKGRGPLSFKAGAGQMIPGFDRAVIGMKLNEKKRITLKPKDAYGLRNKNLIKNLPRSTFPKNLTPKKGMKVRMRDSNGRMRIATIIKITRKAITVDLNHFLAGKVLIFDIKVVGIE